MYPFTAINQNKDNSQINEADEAAVKSSEAFQGDEALISTIKELNELRHHEEESSELP